MNIGMKSRKGSGMVIVMLKEMKGNEYTVHTITQEHKNSNKGVYKWHIIPEHVYRLQAIHNATTTNY